MSDNNLKGDQLSKIAAAFPNIRALAFGGNSIKTIAELRPLESLKNLSQLDLFNNPVSSLAEYRSQVFALLPSLKVSELEQVLDLRDTEGKDYLGEDSEFEADEEEEYDDDEFIDNDRPQKAVDGDLGEDIEDEEGEEEEDEQ